MQIYAVFYVIIKEICKIRKKSCKTLEIFLIII
jgi:hypothetical protein